MDKENINLNCVKCDSFFSTKCRKITAYMLEQLPKSQNNALPEVKTYYVKKIYFIINVICII